MREFPKSFTEQQPLPPAAVERATEVMGSGALHRYNIGPDETDDAALLEKEFAAYVGRRYCVACTSGGFALPIALRALLPAPGAPVLCNAFTLSPVPGAIHNAGGVAVPVETDASLTIDCADLRHAAETYAARCLVLTHMRGHIADMDAEEVDLINMSPNQIAAAWERGDIDGAFVWNPVLSELLDSGRLLISSGQLANWGKPTFDAFVVDPEFAEANPEFMRDFISVVADYAARYTDNRAAWTADSAEVQLIARNTGADPADVPPVLNGIEFPSLERQASPLWLGGGVAEGLRATAEFLEAQGEIDSVADDYSRYVDASWVESLVSDQ